MIKPEKFGHLHLVYHFTVSLRFLLLQRNQLQIGTSEQSQDKHRSHSYKLGIQEILSILIFPLKFHLSNFSLTLVKSRGANLILKMTFSLNDKVAHDQIIPFQQHRPEPFLYNSLKCGLQVCTLVSCSWFHNSSMEGVRKAEVHILCHNVVS